MLTISKDQSLLTAEAVLAILMVMNGDGTEVLQDIDLSVDAATIGRTSALRIGEEFKGNFAWVLRNTKSFEIRVITGRRSNNSYTFEDVPVPNDHSTIIDFDSNDYYGAAQRIFSFFTA
jgi:hypothetical protein